MSNPAVVGQEPCSKSTSDDDMSMLYCDCKEGKDVVGVSIEKMPSTFLSDAKRDSSNKVFGDV